MTETKTPDFKLASRPQRLTAFLIDIVFINILAYVANLILDLVGGNGVSAEALSSDFTNSLTYTMITILYFPVFTALWAATPGKKILKIKVVLANGENLTTGKVILRETIGRWVSSFTFGFVWIFFNKSNKNVWDFIAGTVVVKNPA